MKLKWKMFPMEKLTKMVTRFLTYMMNRII